MLERYIQANKIANGIQTADIQEFVLKNRKNFEAEMLNLVADQWLSRQKAKHKLPTWFANENVIFPPPLSVEQASSEITAQYKAQVFVEKFGKNPVIDLTSGMGLDTWALAKVCESVTYVEQNALLAEIANYNFEVLGQKNIEVLNENSIDLDISFFEKNANFYLDPHRRDSAKNKVFKIEDCVPNLLNIKHLLKNYMVKFSPMLDIKLALGQLENISEVYVIAIENEVKELLFCTNTTTEVSVAQPSPLGRANCPPPFRGGAGVVCINILSNSHKQIFEFDHQTEEKLDVTYSNPSIYIYEPNAAILKAGAFKSIAKQFNINKLAPNSHLYSSDILVENFAGRSFICEAVCKFDKKEILSKLPQKKANISTRNFSMKPDEIKKKLGLQDGGEYYLFATENFEKQKIVLICRKVLQ